MAESRLNLILQANSQQFNQNLRASQDEIYNTKQALQSLSEQTKRSGEEAQKMSTLQYYLRKEAAEFSLEMPIRGIKTLGKEISKGKDNNEIFGNP